MRHRFICVACVLLVGLVSLVSPARDGADPRPGIVDGAPDTLG